MNALQLDLNLLPKFRALYRRRNVSDAARDLFITQSALSNALARMRELFDDELFVRTSHGMTPTPTADAIWTSIATALETIEDSLERARQFDPASSNRTFAFAATMAAELCALPDIYACLRAGAPNVAISTTGLDERAIAHDLRDRRIEFAIGSFSSPEDDVGSISLLQIAHVCIVRNGQRVSRFAGAYDWPSAENHPNVQTVSLAALPLLVVSSDLAAIVPEPVASRFARTLDLAILPNPFGDERSELRACWLVNRENDPGIRWILARLKAWASLQTGARAIPA
jgi:DNA-binding transcriptional LysR family regulator